LAQPPPARARLLPQIREREERLKLALWASGEQFWDYDLRRGELHWLRAEDSGQAPDIGVQTAVEEDHRIHEEDLPQVRERLRQHLDGTKPVFLSEPGPGYARAGAWSNATPTAARSVSPAPPATSPPAAMPSTNTGLPDEVMRSMNEAVAVLDWAQQYVTINPAFTRTTGYAAAEVLGNNASLLDSTQHDPAFYGHIREQMARQGRWAGEMWQRRKDGEEFLCEIESNRGARRQRPAAALRDRC
jgi:PAS domain S-box-containing protein